ncbi:NADP-dependent oxidoreductase [Marinibaculum pumilum]|uniref:NADP-dependent oxidoreductase n=1 Tax=Marinibaculum pumilum TaxID=1766165 RepID=A0ABV7KY15_9PROT
MKALRIHRFGGPEVAALEDLPVPEPGPGQLLVRMRAASVNPVDYKTRAGRFPVIGAADLPLTLGRDLSGTVMSVGAQVDGFREGQEVYAMVGTDRGALAEYVLVAAEEAAPKPVSLNHAQAAAVPLAALTAWQGLFDLGGLRQGQQVLIHGGAGGVGHFAVQFARDAGARVLATVSAADMDFVRKIGADIAIDYRKERFEDVAHDMDLVFDLVAGEVQDRSWHVLRRGGRLVSTLGLPPEEKADFHGVRAIGFLATPSGRQLAEIGRLIDEGRVQPEVVARFPLDDAPEAERRHEQDHVRGKLVVEQAA